MEVKQVITYDKSKFKINILNKDLFDTILKTDFKEHCGASDAPNFPKYISNIFQTAQYIWVAVKKGSNDIIGFVALQEQEQDKTVLYLTLICGKQPGVGTMLMNTVILFSKQNNASAIFLESIPTKVSFYKKFGFLIGTNCKTLYQTLTSQSSFHRHEKQKRDIFQGLDRSDIDSMIQFTSLDEMMNNEDAKQFIKNVAKNDVLVNDSKECKKLIKESIEKNDFGKEVQEFCLDHGILMYLCFPVSYGGSRRRRRKNIRRKNKTYKKRRLQLICGNNKMTKIIRRKTR